MIAEKTAKIIKEFCDLNAKAGGICSEWHIGVTSDVERHLFGELGIARNYPWYIHRRAVSEKEARAIVLGFHNIGFEANLSSQGIEDESAIYVFAYRKTVAIEKEEIQNQLRA